MARIKNKSDRAWSGHDLDGKALGCRPGDACDMSAARAEMLVKDYPEYFEIVSEVEPKPLEDIGALDIEITEGDEEKPRRGRKKGK